MSVQIERRFEFYFCICELHYDKNNLVSCYLLTIIPFDILHFSNIFYLQRWAVMNLLFSSFCLFILPLYFHSSVSTKLYWCFTRFLWPEALSQSGMPLSLSLSLSLSLLYNPLWILQVWVAIFTNLQIFFWLQGILKRTE